MTKIRNYKGPVSLHVCRTEKLPTELFSDTILSNRAEGFGH